jgi:hypothetical protein
MAKKTLTPPTMQGVEDLLTIRANAPYFCNTYGIKVLAII